MKPKRFRLLQGHGSNYHAIPGARKAASAYAALSNHLPSDGYWVVLCEDGTYVEYEVLAHKLIRVRPKHEVSA